MSSEPLGSVEAPDCPEVVVVATASATSCSVVLECRDTRADICHASSSVHGRGAICCGRVSHRSPFQRLIDFFVVIGPSCGCSFQPFGTSLRGMGVLARRSMFRVYAFVGLVIVLAVSAATPAPGVSARAAGLPSWHFTKTATRHALRAVDVVDRSVIWASSGGFRGAVNDGTVLRSVDGGRSWQDVTPPGGTLYQFRDVEAFDRNHALVLAVPREPGPTRFYRTADGGVSWQLVFRDPNPSPDALYDCMAFFDHRRGLAVGDTAGSEFLPIQATVDGGRTWRLAPTRGMPAAVPGDGALASGTCLVTQGRNDAWFGTAGIQTGTPHSPQVFHTRNGGRTWTVADTPIPASTGIASMAFRDRRHGLAVGGNVSNFDEGFAARTSDGGKSWALADTPGGFRGSVAWVWGRGETAVTVGISGSDVSFDGGRSWRRFDSTVLLGINCSPHAGCWAVGENGVAAQLKFPRR
ncbi:oxidoreductase [Streptomyces sp. NPDC047043]|uniref:WD40/YVTN/BNR-like repeat-containing protein n=1 Tax=Streptomyces sp. NPDC047043 TaxID=3154497 RepID=UPI0033D8089F